MADATPEDTVMDADTRKLLTRLWGAGAVAVDHTSDDGPTRINFSFQSRAEPSNPLTNIDLEAITLRLWQYAARQELVYTGLTGASNLRLARSFAGQVYHNEHARVVTTLDSEQKPAGVVGALCPTDFPAGEPVLMLGFVARSGQYLEQKVDQLKAKGYAVDDCLVLINFDRSAVERLAYAGTRLHSIVTLRDTLALYEEEGLLAREDLRDLQASLMQHV